jgi:hypothetical protein
MIGGRRRPGQLFAALDAEATVAREIGVGVELAGSATGKPTLTHFPSGVMMGLREYSYAATILSLAIALDDVTFLGARAFRLNKGAPTLSAMPIDRRGGSP